MKRSIAIKHKLQRQEHAREEALAHPYVKKTWLTPVKSAAKSLRAIEISPERIRLLSQITSVVVAGAALGYLISKMGPRLLSGNTASGSPEPVQPRAASDLDAAVAP